FVLDDDEIPNDVGVAIEFRIPYSSKRVDFLISGENGKENTVIVVELKQWEKVEKIDAKEAIVKTPMRYGLVETTHPSYQSWSYALIIKDYNENIQQKLIELQPIAYLHNYIIQEKTDLLNDPIYSY